MNKPQSPRGDQLDRLKLQAAERAVEWIASGMVVGLGSGTTAILAVRKIGALLREGKLNGIVAVPTSAAIEAEARRLAIPLAPLEKPPAVDLTIDGADEVDAELNLIKGGGGALLREKIVAQLSRREVIVVDGTKLSARLGTRCGVPLEVIPFAWQAHVRYLESLWAEVTLRCTPDGRPYETDQGNYILDCAFGPIDRPQELADKLAARAGIVEHGLFMGLATDVVVATSEGIQHLSRTDRTNGPADE
jgi:ribose 5-phosphate isomerase A